MSDQGSPAAKEVESERRSQSPSPRGGGETSPRDRERSRSPGARGGDDDSARSNAAQAPDADAVNPGNNIYVANLPHRLAQQDLEDMFSKFGRLERCELIIDPVTRESRGFAFVTFEDLRDAEDAVKELNGKELQGRRVRVEVAKRRRGHDKTPGKYLGPRLASTKYGDDGGRGRGYGDRDGGRRGGRSRSRSRDRYARDRYDDRDRHDRGHDRGRYEDRGRRRSYDRYEDRRRR